MNGGESPLTFLRVILERVSQIPTDWPFIFFIPVIIGIYFACQEKIRLRLAPFAKPVVLVASVLTLLATFRIIISYLWMNSIGNPYAATVAMTSWLFCLGQPLYSDSHVQEPYSLPYGPYTFLLVGCFQHLLGPTIFSSKLGPFLATVGSFIFLYLALRTRVKWLFALALTALASALLLPFDPLEFWPRPDPFLLLTVSGGLYVSTRFGKAGPLLLGALIGFAINLKIYSFAFFFMIIALAWRKNKSPALWLMAAFVTAVAALLPFAWPGISAGDYLRILKMDTSTRVMIGYAVEYAEWSTVFIMVALSPLFTNKWQDDELKEALHKNWGLAGSLLLSFIVVVYPAAHEGANYHHMMPLVPLVMYLAAHLYTDISSKPFFRRVPARMGLSMVLSIVVFAEAYALFLSIKPPATFQENVLHLKEAPTFQAYDASVRERIEDCKQIYAKKMPCVLLFIGSNPAQEDDFYNTLLVFNGMPMGFNPAVCEDYEYLGNYTANLPAFITEIKSKYNKPIVWICEKGISPFSQTSMFGTGEKIFSDKFVNDFNRLFQLSGHSTCFDIYEQKSD